jgi:hypothetical protein
LLTTLRSRWTGDREASENLERFEEKPDRYRPVFEDILTEKLASDRSLATDVERILKEMGPTLDIVQRMDRGEQVVGLEAKEMVGGSARIEQDIKEAKDVKGAKIDRLG